MKNLLYKEFRLAINPFFYFLPLLTGALMLIPGWLYFFVFFYFCVITVPNAFAAFKAQNDLVFSIMLPVRKKDIVKSRILFFLALELLHIVIAAAYAMLHMNIYKNARFIFLVPNIAFFGLTFIMFALFNIVLFPMFYKTAYKYSAPVIASSAAILLFAAAAEVLALFNTNINMYLKSTDAGMVLLQSGILGGGIILFVLSAIAAYKISVVRFEKVDV